MSIHQPVFHEDDILVLKPPQQPSHIAPVRVWRVHGNKLSYILIDQNGLQFEQSIATTEAFYEVASGNEADDLRKRHWPTAV